MKTRHIYLVLSFALSFQPCKAQELPSKHMLSIEGLGPGGYGSVNYERNFNRKENRFTTFRIGLGVTQNFVPSIPHGVTWNFGRKNNYFETGVLATLGYSSFGFADNSASLYYLGPAVGYRRQGSGKGFFRVFAQGFVTVDRYPDFYVIGGLGFGFPLRKRTR